MDHPTTMDPTVEVELEADENIVNFPAHGTNQTPAQALGHAMNRVNSGLYKRVLIIAEDDDGEVYSINSFMSHADALWLVKRTEMTILGLDNDEVQ